MDEFGWAEEEVPPPTDADAPPLYDDPSSDVEPWELTVSEKRIYEAGFTTAYLMRTSELEQLTRDVERLNHEADRPLPSRLRPPQLLLLERPPPHSPPARTPPTPELRRPP